MPTVSAILTITDNNPQRQAEASALLNRQIAEAGLYRQYLVSRQAYYIRQVNGAKTTKRFPG
nr:hypothetical protein [Pseudomonas sp. BIGb0427]